MTHPAQPAFILALPEEVLVNIVEEYVQVAANKKQRYRISLYCEGGIPGNDSVPTEASEYARAELARLALVCRRFYPIATQVLYKNLSLHYDPDRFKWDAITHFHGNLRDPAHTVPGADSKNDGEKKHINWRPRPGPHLLYRTLMGRPSLRGHCQTLRLTLDLNDLETDDDDADNHEAPNPVLLQSVVRNMFSWLRNITMLDLNYKDEPDSIDILAALSQNLGQLQQLRTLAISYTKEILLLPDLYYGIIRKLPKLHSLSVHEAGSWQHVDYHDTKRFPPLDKLKLPPSSLASICFFNGFKDSPRNLEWFFRQPLNLTNFSFYLRYYGHGSGPKTWSLPVLLTLLRHQRQTLRSISIGHIYDGPRGLGNVDLSDFSSLEEITLDAWRLAITTYHPTPPGGLWREPEVHLAVDEGHVAFLSAPKLRKITLCFDGYRVRHDLTSFGEEQEAWLRELVLAAARGKKALKELHFDYRPGPVGIEEVRKVRVWPWARINRVREMEEVKKAGIVITYEEPRISEREFEEMLVQGDKEKS